MYDKHTECLKGVSSKEWYGNIRTSTQKFPWEFQAMYGNQREFQASCGKVILEKAHRRF